MGGEPDHGHQDEERGDMRHRGERERLQPRRHARDRLSPRKQQRQPTITLQARQRDDEGWNAEPVDRPAIDDPDRDPHRERGDEGHQQALPGIGDQHAEDDAGQPSDRAHREVDPGEDDRKERAEGEDRVDRDLAEDVGDVARGPEIGREHPEQHPDQHRQRKHISLERQTMLQLRQERSFRLLLGRSA